MNDFVMMTCIYLKYIMYNKCVIYIREFEDVYYLFDDETSVMIINLKYLLKIYAIVTY